MADHAPKPITPPPAQWSNRQMAEIAARAVGKVVRDDMRALTSLSVDEIAAMTGMLIALGLVAILPDQPTPETLIILPKGGPK